MMKHITNQIIAVATAALVALSLCSCDEKDRDDRFIELPAIEAKRVVLMEEFTGQICVNCPAAHEVIAGLLSQYPDNLISVSIHGGGDAFSYSEEALPGYGLRNSDGQAYCDSYGVAALPAAVINRNSGVLNSDDWASKVREAMETPSYIDMDIRANYNEDRSEIHIMTHVTPHEKYSDTYLQLWVVESGIKSLQLTPTGIKVDYEHNHVFRATVNGHDGQPVKLEIGKEEYYENTIAVRDIWNADNLTIVGFVYNKAGVQQAAHDKVR